MLRLSRFSTTSQSVLQQCRHQRHVFTQLTLCATECSHYSMVAVPSHAASTIKATKVRVFDQSDMIYNLLPVSASSQHWLTRCVQIAWARQITIVTTE